MMNDEADTSPKRTAFRNDRMNKRRKRPLLKSTTRTRSEHGYQYCNTDEDTTCTNTNTRRKCITSNLHDKDGDAIFEFTETGEIGTGAVRTQYILSVSGLNTKLRAPIPILSNSRITKRRRNSKKKQAEIQKNELDYRITKQSRLERSYKLSREVEISTGTRTRTHFSNCHDEKEMRMDAEKSMVLSLPGLLYSRVIGSMRNPRGLCLKAPKGNDGYGNLKLKTRSKLKLRSNISKSNWRGFAKRRIQFSKLATPETDAVLAMDRSGSYLIAIGDGILSSRTVSRFDSSLDTEIDREVEDGMDDGNYDRGSGSRAQLCCGNDSFLTPSLSLRFYATPSPAALMQKRDGRNVPSHVSSSLLVCSIPLLFETCGDEDESDYMNNSVTTPVQLLMSSDGMMGVALVHHCKRDEDISGSIALFPLPKMDSMNKSCTEKVTKIYRLPRTGIAGIHAHTLRNLLWTTPILPSAIKCLKDDIPCSGAMGVCISEIPLLCDVFRETRSGYMFLNDEDDGFRIFWIDIASRKHLDSACAFIESEPLTTRTHARYKIRPKRNDIVTTVGDSSLETEWANTFSGYAGYRRPSGECCNELNIILEGYLKVSALLSDILHRRRNLVSSSSDVNASPQLPDYFYNLISIGKGRSATLVVVFNNPQFSQEKDPAKKVPAAYGVIIKIDLFDHSYTEIKWLQHPTRNNTKFMRRWSNYLASINRMAEMKVGPYCVRSSKEIFHVETHEQGTDDHDEDTDVELWKFFVGEGGNECKVGEEKVSHKPVGMSSMYPICDIINNDAVTSGKPVKYISCRDFPLELSYN